MRRGKVKEEEVKGTANYRQHKLHYHPYELHYHLRCHANYCCPHHFYTSLCCCLHPMLLYKNAWLLERIKAQRRRGERESHYWSLGKGL